MGFNFISFNLNSNCNIVKIKITLNKKIKNGCLTLTLGGDYYDYIPLSKDKFLICIADVSGKGIEALLMSE